MEHSISDLKGWKTMQDYTEEETARRYNMNITQRNRVKAGARSARIPQSSERCAAAPAAEAVV
jgi:hypothetical protein